jgi:TIR domain
VKPRHDVFISYSHDDRETASALRDALKVAGVGVWTDNDTAVGANWEDHLREAMGKAGAVIFLVTPASLASAYVMSEIGAAVAARKLVIPVVPTNGRVPRELPAPLRTWQLIRAGSRGAGEVTTEILERLEHLPVSEST